MSGLPTHSMTGVHETIADTLGGMKAIPMPPGGDWDEAAVTQSYHDLTLECPFTFDHSIVYGPEGHDEAAETLELAPPARTSDEHPLAVGITPGLRILMPNGEMPAVRSLDDVASDLGDQPITHLIINPQGIGDSLPPVANDIYAASNDHSYGSIVVDERSLDALATTAYRALESIHFLINHSFKFLAEGIAREGERKVFAEYCGKALDAYQALGKVLQTMDPDGTYDAFTSEIYSGGANIGDAPAPDHILKQFILGSTLAAAMYSAAAQSHETNTPLDNVNVRLEMMTTDQDGNPSKYSHIVAMANNVLAEDFVAGRGVLLDVLKDARTTYHQE
jgi:hypothetical protein